MSTVIMNSWPPHEINLRFVISDYQTHLGYKNPFPYLIILESELPASLRTYEGMSYRIQCVYVQLMLHTNNQKAMLFAYDHEIHHLDTFIK